MPVHLILADAILPAWFVLPIAAFTMIVMRSL